MEKIIWVLDKKRESILDIQRKINAQGSMKAICILSPEALKKNLNELFNEKLWQLPSVILMDYEIASASRTVMDMIKNNENTCSVPVIITLKPGMGDLNDTCILMGAAACVSKPISYEAVMEIEQLAAQYDDKQNISEMSKDMFVELHAYTRSEIEAAKDAAAEADTNENQEESAVPDECSETAPENIEDNAEESAEAENEAEPAPEQMNFLRDVVKVDMEASSKKEGRKNTAEGVLLGVSYSTLIVDLGENENEEYNELGFSEFMISGVRRGEPVFSKVQAKVLIAGCGKIKAEVVYPNIEFTKFVEEISNGIY